MEVLTIILSLSLGTNLDFTEFLKSGSPASEGTDMNRIICLGNC